jgi:hypothetical protein
MDYTADAEAARQRQIVAFRARFAVVKGYAQLLARQSQREGVPREQLANHSAILQSQLSLLEDLARQLLYDHPNDELLDESVKPARQPERSDGATYS